MSAGPRQPSAIQSPLQLFGLFLAWTESAFAAGLFATDRTGWPHDVLVCVMAFGLVAYVGVAGFLLVYLVVKRPEFLFNPSDYDKSVQHMLFGPGVPGIAVTGGAINVQAAAAAPAQDGNT